MAHITRIITVVDNFSIINSSRILYSKSIFIYYVLFLNNKGYNNSGACGGGGGGGCGGGGGGCGGGGCGGGGCGGKFLFFRLFLYLFLIFSWVTFVLISK